jgi:MFS family permease
MLFAWKYLRESVGLRQTAEHSLPAASPGNRGGALTSVVSHAGEPASRLIWIYTLAIGAFYGTAPLLSLLFADRLGVTEKTVGYFVMYFGAMGVIVRAGFLGIAVERLGEARLARVGLVLLAAGLGVISVARSYTTMFIAITLMPLGTAFLFPCVTALLSRVVPSRERGLYMGVQQTYGGVSRVAFPLLAGFLMDRFGTGSPYAVAAVLVAATLLITAPLEQYMRPPALTPTRSVP